MSSKAAKLFMSILLLVISGPGKSCGQSGLRAGYAFGGAMNGNKNAGGGGGSGSTLNTKHMGPRQLPPGYANIYGEIMDMSNKLIQRITSAGTNYFTYDNQNGAPVFRRREMDSGRRFIIFPDAAYPPGEGHYIVLRRMPGVMIPGMIAQPLYETFRLSLGDSIHAYMEPYKGNAGKEVNQGGHFNGLSGTYGAPTSGYSAAISQQSQSSSSRMQMMQG